MNNLRFLRNSAAWLAAAVMLPVTHASDAVTAGDARIAVAHAERAVAAARAQNALWTSAEDALRRAERAMADGNAAAALECARFAAGQAKLGLEQKHYPLTR